jgi:hypothetical protein
MEGVKSMNTVTVDTGSLGPRAVSLLSGYRRLVGAARPYSIPLPAAVALYVVGAAGRPAALAVIAASTAAVLVRVVVEVVRIETQREQADRWIITHTGQPYKPDSTNCSPHACVSAPGSSTSASIPSLPSIVCSSEIGGRLDG